MLRKLFRMQKLKCTKKYTRSWTPKTLKRIYRERITRIRGRKTRDLCTMRCIKDDQKVLVRDEEIKKRWRESIFTDYLMIILLKIWVTLPFSVKI